MAAYTAVDDSEAYFQTELYTGTGSSLATTFDGDTDMVPDLIWIKNRETTDSSSITNAAFGVNSQSHSDGTARTTDTDHVTAFGSDGFTVGTDVTVNTSDEAYAAWCWKGGTTSGITTDGNTTITPAAYSFSQTAGTAFLKYAGNTTSGAKVAHGLGAVPHLMITRNMSAGVSWNIYHHKNTAAPETDYLELDTADTTADAADRWNDTAPDSVNFTIGDAQGINGNTDNILAFVFSEKQGFSKFGSYTGNGNADSAFIYLGFRPAFFMLKASSAGAEEWRICDNKRDPENVMDRTFKANLAESDTDADVMDFVSNGVKLRSTDGGVNYNDRTYIYAAFAEAPFVNSEGVPCNAR